MNRVPMTVQGAQKLREELSYLKQIERPRIIQAIAEARAHGDLRENAEYHAAREQQSFAEGRIADIESKLSFSQIIDVSKLNREGKVVFGVTITLINLDDDDKKTYQIVGDDESDVANKKISINSPIARALIGKEEGDVVSIKTPSGEVNYEIEEVLYE